MEDEQSHRLQHINLVNNRVIVEESYNGATPLHAAICFLQQSQSPEESQVIVFTPKEDLYMVNEHVDTQHTRLTVDDWLLQNGQKGRIARLLSQIQIIRVEDLIQLAICLAVYPSSNLHQETPEEALMIIIHDMSILPSDSTQTDVATTLASPTPGSHYLPIVGNGLAAVQLCKNKSQLLVLDSYMDSSSRQTLKCYLEEERIPLDLPSDGLA